MKTFQNLVNSILTNSNSTLALNIKLSSLWSNIIGKEFENVAIFERASYISSKKINVYLTILNSAAIFMTQNKNSIIDKIKENQNLDEVNLILKHTAKLKQDKDNAA